MENQEFELTDQHQYDGETEETIMERIVSEYVDRVESINQEHRQGVEPENQTKIGDLISDGKRKKDESQHEYKMRRKAEQLIIKHYRKGVRGR